MRLWTATLVLTAILISSGGVAFRPRAEPQLTPDSTPVDLGAIMAAAEQEPKACEERGRSGEFRLDLSKLEHRPGFVSLNTQGYNYRPERTNSHQQVPASVRKD